MPWRVTSPMHERQRFVLDAQSARCAFAELCPRYGISRKTGYKWLARYAAAGPDSLADRSHRPQGCPQATHPAVVREIFQLRKSWRWGARKLQQLLRDAHPVDQVPALATIHRILVRHGRVPRRRRSQLRAHPGRPQTPITGPNVVWSVDFKGQFKMGDGHYCYPLTVQDAYSRRLLAPARGSMGRCCSRPSTCSAGSFAPTGCPSAFAPTMASRLPRVPSAASRSSACGGFGWAFARNSSSPPARTRMAVMSACTKI